MGGGKSIEKDLDDISSVLEVWNHRLKDSNIVGTDSISFLSNSFDELAGKSLKALDDFDITHKAGLLRDYDSLTGYDSGLSIIAGSMGAFVPKLTNQFFNRIHDQLSHCNGFLGKLFNHDGEWIDSIERGGRRRILGSFHRFRPDGKHDLLNLSGLATSISQFGILKGTLKYIIHLSLDSCSKTGIPVPGTTNFLHWIRETFGMRLFGLKDISSSASIRMGDILQTGVTSGILLLYCKTMDIPSDSLRRPQLGILGHGISIAGSAYIAAQTNNPQMLSKISYPACLMLIKNSWSLYHQLNSLSSRIRDLDEEIEKVIQENQAFTIRSREGSALD